MHQIQVYTTQIAHVNFFMNYCVTFISIVEYKVDTQVTRRGPPGPHAWYYIFQFLMRECLKTLRMHFFYLGQVLVFQNRYFMGN